MNMKIKDEQLNYIIKGIFKKNDKFISLIWFDMEELKRSNRDFTDIS